MRKLTGLDALLAPYSSALGTASGSYDMSSDPIYGPLFGGGSDALDALAALSGVRSSRGSSYTGATTGAAGPIDLGNALAPNSPLLISNRGVTLQQSALDALLQAARESSYLPGARELTMFGPQATYRTPAEQASLYARKPGVAAPPGKSLHQQGLAIDLPSALQNEAFFSILRSLGWHQLPSESWHWSYGTTG